MSAVRTDNYITADGLDTMALHQGGYDGQVIVSAKLVDNPLSGEQQWLIEAGGFSPATAGTRTRAIEVMGDMSLLVLGVSGASLFVPPEVVGLP